MYHVDGPIVLEFPKCPPAEMDRYKHDSSLQEEESPIPDHPTSIAADSSATPPAPPYE